jgi:large subunit ribosomal protein L2
MAVRKLRPITPGQRHKVVNTFDGITTSSPEKSLLAPIKRSGGRNNSGRMTMRYIGGGHKKTLPHCGFQKREVWNGGMCVHN